MITIDVDDRTLQTAKDSRADHVFNSRTCKDYIEQIHSITNGGCDAVAIFAAVKAGYDSAPAVLRIGDNLVCVGIPPQDITFSAMDITMMRYYIFAANNAVSPKQLKECAEFTAKHGINSPSQFFKLDQINEMIGIMSKEKMRGSRLVVKFDEGNASSKI